jgi:zinc D-Ala-D-Ala carboxypeptidase
MMLLYPRALLCHYNASEYRIALFSMYDDIPEAVRQSVKEPSRISAPLIGLMIGGGILGLLAIILLLLRPQAQPVAQPSAAPSSVSSAGSSTPSSAISSTAPSSTPAPIQASAPPIAASASPSASSDLLLGHLPYAEAPADELEAISPDGQFKLRRVAAAAYQKMAAAAAADGVNLSIISAFRSVADQNDLFFRVKEERNQGVSKRAEVSAPPGHSEHHTGYAIDIGDAARPDTNLSQSFEETSAYRWLAAHAAQYSFEMSFTRGNPQGVSYEPWHWRYVGDQNSLETFYRAQHLKPDAP